jgi:hypothetical protein
MVTVITATTGAIPTYPIHPGTPTLLVGTHPGDPVELTGTHPNGYTELAGTHPDGYVLL